MKRTVMIETTSGVEPSQMGAIIKLYAPKKISLHHDTMMRVNLGIKFNFNERGMCLMIIPARDEISLVSPEIVVSDKEVSITIHTYTHNVNIEKGKLLAYAIPIRADDVHFDTIRFDNEERTVF